MALASARELSQIHLSGGDETAVNIFFLDNASTAVLINSTTTVGDVLEQFAGRFFHGDRSLADCFGIFESEDGSTTTRQAVPTERLSTLQFTSAKLVYKIAYLGTKLQQAQGATEQRFMYIQAMHEVATGQLVVNKELALNLAGYVLCATFDAFRPEVHTAEFYFPRVMEYVSSDLLPSMKPRAWARALQNAHKSASEGLRTQESKQDMRSMARATYLSCISELPQWGAHCFPVKQDSISEIPRRIICAVRRDAVLLLQRKTFQQFDLFGLNEFARWGFDPGRSFHFILKDDDGEADEETGMFIFFSKEGERFAHTLSKFAELWMLSELSGDSQPEPHQHLAHEQQRLAPEQLLHEQQLPVAEKQEPPRPIFTSGIAAVRIQAMIRRWKCRLEFERHVRGLEAACARDEKAFLEAQEKSVEGT